MSEREKFEAAWRKEYPLHGATTFKRSGFNPDAYVNTRVQDGWLMWQARAAASAQATGQAVGYMMKHKTGTDIGFAWKADDPQFSSDWLRVPLGLLATPPSPDAREAGGGVTLSADRIEQIMSLVEQHGDYRWAHCIGGRGYDAKKAVETRDRIRAILREAGSGK